jgi:hypothetical protein
MGVEENDDDEDDHPGAHDAPNHLEGSVRRALLPL